MRFDTPHTASATMTAESPRPATAPAPEAPVIACRDLTATIAEYEARGLRLDMIAPADAPRTALMSGPDGRVHLESSQPAPCRPDWSPDALVVIRADTATDAPGRAGMHYRDLIPSRMDGRFIVSRISIPEGGPVPDYVHYHRVGFQIIYCLHGWVRVLYQDQGPALTMVAGDCVLQPPGIRHRVLEASPGLTVLEVASPAEHETWRDHTLELPTAVILPARTFEGQRFVHSIAATSPWQPGPWPGFEVQETGIGAASAGHGEVRRLRSRPPEARTERLRQQRVFSLLMSISGRLTVHGPTLGEHRLDPGDACLIPTGAEFSLSAASPSEWLWVEAD